MSHTLLATAAIFPQLQQYLLDALRDVDFADLRGFWLSQVFDDRLVVCYAIPVGLLLLALRPRRLRIGIILSGLAFLGYLCGAAYALFWLGLCVVLFRLGEIFARETKRTDIIRAGPLLGAWLVIGLGYFGSFFLMKIDLPDAWNTWLMANMPWIFPLGARGVWWEPDLVRYYVHDAGAPLQLFQAVFWNPHNIGTAYLAVRMLQYFSELKRDTIPASRRTLVNFLAWLCYAPNLLQGPIERYAEFQSEMDTCRERRAWANVPPALGRIGWGVFKTLIATIFFLPAVRDRMATYYAHPEQIESYAFLYFGVYINIFWLYLEFSAYCDISAGIARLLGYRQVENFNWPWLATSLRDFWRRWHISLSLILRDYVYIALGGNRRHVLFNLCATFALIGIWHAPMLQLALWGALMGFMLWVNQAWVRWMKRVDAEPLGRLAAVRRACARLQPIPQLFCWAITMHFFVHSLLLFFGGGAIVRVTWELIRRPVIYFFQN